MRLFVILCLAGFYAGCASTRVAVDVPPTSPVRSERDLTGRYANRGLGHSPTENRPFEEWLEDTLGLTHFRSVHGDVLAIGGEDDTLTFTSFASGRILRETILKKDRDYHVTEPGVELVRFSVGSGGEGSLVSKITTRVVFARGSDGSLVVRSIAVGTGLAGLNKSSVESWYEFKKEG